jgi:thymidylate synthase
MHFKFQNVNDAFESIVRGIADETIPTISTPSRNGPVLQIEEPVIVTYTNPSQRLLLNKERDANPFFHLFEAMWMLAGRNDLDPLLKFVKTFGQFSDNGKTLNGAYGYRWRAAMDKDREGNFYSHPIDQLDLIISHLKATPGSRRAVLQMWNVEDDLLRINPSFITDKKDCPDCGRDWGHSYCGTCFGNRHVFKTIEVPPSKDVCCNLSVMFSIKTEHVNHNWSHNELVSNIEREHEKSLLARSDGDLAGVVACTNRIKLYQAGFKYKTKTLDMTVTNRSNDIVWGMLGANYVHFSFLQEYMACGLNVHAGLYHHFTNNAHVYTETNSGFHPNKWLKADKIQFAYPDHNGFTKIKLFEDFQRPDFDSQVQRFVSNPSDCAFKSVIPKPLPFFQHVAFPMIRVWDTYKEFGAVEAAKLLKEIESEDWRLACSIWLDHRTKPSTTQKGV